MAEDTEAAEAVDKKSQSAASTSHQNGKLKPSQNGIAKQETAEFAVGNKVVCTATHDSQPHPAELLDRRVDAAGHISFYVHYLDRDKRLDEWVSVDRLGAKVPPVPSGLLRLETVPSLALPVGDLVGVAGEQKITRRLKRRFEETHLIPTPHDDSKDHGAEKEHQERNRVKNIQSVEFGKYEMDTWYYSPYPEPYASERHLYICEYTLKYFRKKKTLLRHLAKLDARHPPGDEIYRSPAPPREDPNRVGGPYFSPPVAVFEVDGKKNKVYCQNLCLLSKLFLDHKTLYYDVDPFLFYILCEVDQEGYHTVGYFSKEKNCQDNYNLACILTLPCYQRKGYGKFLIAFAYTLSKLEGRPGTAERPLSDLGQVSFRSYWRRTILNVLRDSKGDISVQDISDQTMMLPQDIIDTLKGMNLLLYWKGTHVIAANPKTVEDYLRSTSHQHFPEVDVSHLHWQPLQTPAPGKK